MSRLGNRIILVMLALILSFAAVACVAQPACAPGGPNVEFCGA